MKTVTDKDIFRIIECSEESMADSTGYSRLPGMSSASPYDFFVETFKPNHSDCEFEYNSQWDGDGDGMNGRGCGFESQFEGYTDYEGEWNTFWSAFFNSSEVLNIMFWKDLDDWEVEHAELMAEKEAEE